MRFKRCPPGFFLSITQLLRCISECIQNSLNWDFQRTRKCFDEHRAARKFSLKQVLEAAQSFGCVFVPAAID